MTVTYQVGGGGHLDIDFWVRVCTMFWIYSTPTCTTAFRPRKQSTSQTNKAIDWHSSYHCRKRWQIRVLFLKYDERYFGQDRQVCQVGAVMLLPAANVRKFQCPRCHIYWWRWYASMLLNSITTTDMISKADVVAPIEREIRSLANGLISVKDEQEYIVVRERVHRNTAESTNTRVKWWSILQAIVLFAVVAWQVIYLKVRSSSPILGLRLIWWCDAVPSPSLKSNV